ncbi:mediator of RNA polymerase II transcription subunit 15a-like [Bidens hawaiensis]|uniref:mediator of RNA polymerase II transcription subunit 15a-like n=1 Tax=Bidens hawaiensis TaxID=980011 RepID=UPI00404A49A7
MDNWRPTQGASGAAVDPSMESGNWRAQLQTDSRQRIVNKIMETLKKHLPFSGNEGLQELQRIAMRFEEKIYTAATSQADYLRKISLKMLTMENRSQNPGPDAMQSSSAATSVNPSDPGTQVMQQGQQLPISVPSNSSQSGQQMMSQSMHDNIGSTGMQGSSSLSSALPPGSSLQQSTMANVAGQSSNLQNIQNMSGVQQSTVGNTMGPSSFANQRQQIQGRQQLDPQQQQQQQTQNSHYHYQQQQLQQLANQKLQQPSMQQNLLQPGHLQPSQQPVMQPAMMQTSSLSSVQTQQPVVPQSSQPLMSHQQSVLRQRQQVQPTQQQAQPVQQNTNMQQNQLIGQQNNYSDMQQQRLIGQQNRLPSVQQPQQQLIGQLNNLSSMQQQQSGNSSMQANQHAVQQMMQSSMPMQQQNHHSSATLLPTQVQPPLTQLQQQVGMQQQPNLLQRDMQHRLPTSGVFQQQNVIDQQKQLFQQQRVMPEASSTSLDSTAQTINPNGGDWQEEVYQKLKAMKDLYLIDLKDMHQKILGKLQQADSLPQQPKNEQLDKLKMFRTMLERYMHFLQIPKHAILPNFKDKLGVYEGHIIQVINSNKRKPVGPQQQAQALPPAHMQSMQQSQQTHSQLTQVLSHETQTNLQSNMAPMQANIMGNLSGGSNVQQNMMNTIQPSSHLDPGQNSNMNSLLQVSSGSLQQNTVSGSQQVNINPMSLQANSNMLQHPHIKQEQLLQNQQMKQFQQRQMQQQFLHKQQFMQQQQFHQQTKQQQPSGQINDVSDIKPRQQMGMMKSGAYQQHQRSAYHQQLKPGAPFSPQLLSSASPQMSQHASPQIDQSNMLKSANSPFTAPSPSTSSASPLPGELINGVPSLSNVGNTGHQQPSSAVAIGTPGISASPLLAEFTSPDGTHGAVASIGAGKSVTEQPLERLLKVVKLMSPKALSESVSDIDSVVSMIDRIAGSAPGNGSRAAVGEDLVAMTKCRLQARNFVTQDGTNGARKMKRFTSAMPLNVVSSAGSVNDSYLNGSENSELDSTASSSIKRPRIEYNHALLEEIKEINRGLIDTVVSISEEDVDPAAIPKGGDGTMITCSFSAVALGPNLKSQYASAQMSPIQPLRLLVPANYPNCSPILLDKFPAEISKEFEDISTKTKSRFNICLRSLSQPMSLKGIARTWDACAAAVMSEYAQQRGGGTFSSKYGTWENCPSAA